MDERLRRLERDGRDDARLLQELRRAGRDPRQRLAQLLADLVAARRDACQVDLRCRRPPTHLVQLFDSARPSDWSSSAGRPAGSSRPARSTPRSSCSASRRPSPERSSWCRGPGARRVPCFRADALPRGSRVTRIGNGTGPGEQRRRGPPGGHARPCEPRSSRRRSRRTRPARRPPPLRLHPRLHPGGARLQVGGAPRPTARRLRPGLARVPRGSRRRPR